MTRLVWAHSTFHFRQSVRAAATSSGYSNRPRTRSTAAGQRCYSHSWRIALLERFWQARHPPRYAAYLIPSSPSFPHSSASPGISGTCVTHCFDFISSKARCRVLPAGSSEVQAVATDGARRCSLCDVAPRTDRTGLPLGKCKAYNRVYGQSCGSS